jgi:hypothetical protein
MIYSELFCTIGGITTAGATATGLACAAAVLLMFR